MAKNQTEPQHLVFPIEMVLVLRKLALALPAWLLPIHFGRASGGEYEQHGFLSRLLILAGPQVGYPPHPGAAPDPGPVDLNPPDYIEKKPPDGNASGCPPRIRDHAG